MLCLTMAAECGGRRRRIDDRRQGKRRQRLTDLNRRQIRAEKTKVEKLSTASRGVLCSEDVLS